MEKELLEIRLYASETIRAVSVTHNFLRANQIFDEVLKSIDAVNSLMKSEDGYVTKRIAEWLPSRKGRGQLLPPSEWTPS